MVTQLIHAPLRKLLAILPLAFLVLVIYGTRLHDSPIYLTQDETFFGLTAHSIASSGHDVSGKFLPLYFQWPGAISTNIFFQPMLIYFTALFFTILPVSEASLRLPTVFVALADVILVYLIAIRIFKRESLALVAATLLMLTPAHFIHGRLAMDYLYPVPFVLAWFLCLMMFVEDGRSWALFAATLALGVGFYSYIASVVMMPMYFVFTCLLLLLYKKPPRDYAMALAGFVLPLLLVAPWLFVHREAVALTARRYELYGAAYQGPLLGFWGALSRSLRESIHFYFITERVSLYWFFFNPSYLFLTGGLLVVNSTRRFGVFLIPLAVFLPLGVNRLCNSRRTPVQTLLLLGLATAPVSACLVNEPYTIFRELELLPFAVLIATFGMDVLLSARRTIVRLTAIGLLALIPIQFTLFYTDYFGRYAVESAGWFGGNVRDGLEDIIARDKGESHPAIYLPTILPYIDWYWRLYLVKHHQQVLASRTVYFDGNRLDLTTMPRGSVMLLQVGDPAAERFLKSAELRRVRLISQPNGTAFLWILEKL